MKYLIIFLTNILISNSTKDLLSTNNKVFLEIIFKNFNKKFIILSNKINKKTT